MTEQKGLVVQALPPKVTEIDGTAKEGIESVRRSLRCGVKLGSRGAAISVKESSVLSMM
jgi:hypothetical protein